MTRLYSSNASIGAGSTLKSLPLAVAAAAIFAASLLPAVAQAQNQNPALPIIGGVSSVRLTSAAPFAAAGLSINTLGSTLFSPGSDGVPLVYFPITGGSINTGSLGTFGQVEHQGSGLSFSFGDATLNFSNFVIDTAALNITANVATASQAFGVMSVFNFSQSGSAAAPLLFTFTADANRAFSAVLDTPISVDGVVLGLANSVPITTAVPEPATWLSLLTGLGLMSTWVRRRHAPV